jgi:osmoprotectant transport system permease protein
VTWVLANLGMIGQFTLDHLRLAVPPILIAFVVSIPIGWAANRFRRVRAPLLTVAGLLYAVPSFALLIVIPVLFGVALRSNLNLDITLTLYGIALMVRSVADGLASVENDVRQSATAIGFSGWQRFWRVELPLAGPVLLAGLRVVVVSTVSLVTVGGILGISGLGLLFTDGFQRGILEEITTGIVLTVVIALVLDALLVLLGRALMPWSRSPRSAERRAMRKVALAS